jgi:transcriptional regulator with XRE-family HTH domain
MTEGRMGPMEEAVVWSARLGAHLEASRQRAGLRRVDLAARVGVSEETIRLWERGTVQPSPERLARLIPVLAIEASLWQQESPSRDPADDLPELAQRLRAERTARGLTQAAMAEHLRVPQATYAGWETGRTSPGSQHAAAVASLLELDEAEVEPVLAAPFTVDTAGWPPIGQLLGARRQALQLSRAALAELLDTTPRTVMSWELGYRRPSAGALSSLAEALAVPVEAIVDALPRRSVPSRLGELILARQRALGLQSTDVARLVGTTDPTVSRWINGHSRPAGRNLERLATALRVPLSDLYDVVGRTA